MPLTDTSVRNARYKGQPVKLSDEKGLYVLINASGKYWHVNYRFNGKQKTLSLGVYPDVSLANARSRRDDARKLLAAGADPGVVKQQAKQSVRESISNSLESIGMEWFAKNKHTWSDSYADKIFSALQRDVYPWLGGTPVKDITAQAVLQVMWRIDNRGALETAHRTKKATCPQIMRYAIATGRAERDPCPDLKGALPPAKGSHMPTNLQYHAVVIGIISNCFNNTY